MISNILIVGDLHEPFCLDDLLDFNLQLFRKHKCNKVVFNGDILDSHAWSYHKPNPDGMSVGYELEQAKKRLKKWFKAFPKAACLYGNHDLLVSRKAMTAGLSSIFLRDFADIVQTPSTWSFHHEIIDNNILYLHGSTGSAIKRAKDTRMSTIQGHLHSQSFVQWTVSQHDKIFGLQVGCGIDRKNYAFNYGKDFAKKPIIGSGLVLENGRLPLIELMAL